MKSRWHPCVRKYLLAAAWMCFPLVNHLHLIANAAEANCPPAAVVSGADDMVASVAALLRQHGVGSDAKDCRPRVVHASLIRDRDARFHLLHIDDGFGRTSDRKIGDANTAASLIESWALGEDASLLWPRAPTAPAPVEPVAVVAASGVASPSSPPSWRLAAAAAVSSDVDGNRLYGASATGCAHVGRVCVGGRARIARGIETVSVMDLAGFPGFAGGASIDLTRTASQLTVVASLPMTWRHFTCAPLLGLGAGWERATVPSVLVFGVRSDSVRRDDFRVVAEAAAVGGVRLGTHWSLLTDLGASVGRRVSGAPTDPLAARVPTLSAVLLRGSIGIEYAR